VETLRQQLDIQWRDHVQTREQTWKALQIEAALLIGYIDAGFKVSDPWLIGIGGLVCVLAGCFGVAVTVHHRKVQITKFTFIHRIEGWLGLHRKDLLGEVKPPEPFSWGRVLDFRNMASPTFILLMRLAVVALAAIYMVGRLSLSHTTP
jgi:hypothetical protein